MSTKTIQLGQNIDPAVRMYMDSAIQDVFELLSSRLRAEHEGNIADHKALLVELADIRAKLATVNNLIKSDPSHKITKAKLMAIAKELDL